MSDPQKENGKNGAIADFYASLLLILFSALLLYFSFSMPTYEEWGLYATPSLAPIVFGILLLMCALIMLIRSALKHGWAIPFDKIHPIEILRSKPVLHFVVVLGLVIIYFLLMGRLHFVLISGAYVFFNILYFKSTPIYMNLIISVVSSFSIWYLFDQLLLIPLP